MAAHSSLAASQPIGSRPRVVGGHRRLMRRCKAESAVDRSAVVVVALMGNQSDANGAAGPQPCKANWGCVR
jgi:hypothetical protein